MPVIHRNRRGVAGSGCSSAGSGRGPTTSPPGLGLALLLAPLSRLLMASLVAVLLIAGCSSDPDPILLSSTADSVGAEADGDATTGTVAAEPASSPEGSDSVGSAQSPERPPFTVVAQARVGQVTAHADSDPSSPVVGEFANPTPTGGPLVFRAVDGSTDAGGQWIEVQLPVQPNGTTGWIRADEVALTNNPFRIEIDRATFSLHVYRQNSLWLQTDIAVGTGDTPTPVGDFYLMELLSPPDPTGPYGPYAFGLSGFSEVLDSFGGADVAIIGLHGTNEPSSLGTNVSHGCIRIENSIIEQLDNTVPLGTPVLIT